MGVSCGTKQTEETRKKDWVERSIWTDLMLEALEQGVKGGVWFSLIDKVYRPKKPLCCLVGRQKEWLQRRDGS